MISLMKWVLTPTGKAVSALIAIGASAYGLYAYGYASGRADVLAGLASDRVKILVDGKAIDNAVLAADDDALCRMLGGCLQP